MAGGASSKVLALLCSLLRLEGPQLLEGQAGEAEAEDTAGAGGYPTVCFSQQYFFTLSFASQKGPSSEHRLSHIGVSPAGFYQEIF